MNYRILVSVVPVLLCASPLLLCQQGEVATAPQRVGREFPSDDGISLLLIQAERAFRSYDQALDRQKESLEKTIATGDKTSQMAAAAIAALRAAPQTFHSVAGLRFVQSLNYAYENMLFCMTDSFWQALDDAVEGKLEPAALKKVSSKVDTAFACREAMRLMDTVRETAYLTYQRSVSATYELSASTRDQLDACVDMANTARKTQPGKITVPK